MTVVDPPEPAGRELTTEAFMAGLDEGWDPPEPESAPVDPPEPDDPPDPPREAGAPVSLAETQRVVRGLRAAAEQPRGHHAPVTRADLEAIGQHVFQLQYPLPGETR